MGVVVKDGTQTVMGQEPSGMSSADKTDVGIPVVYTALLRSLRREAPAMNRCCLICLGQV